MRYMKLLLLLAIATTPNFLEGAMGRWEAAASKKPPPAPSVIPTESEIMAKYRELTQTKDQIAISDDTEESAATFCGKVFNGLDLTESSGGRRKRIDEGESFAGTREGSYVNRRGGYLPGTYPTNYTSVDEEMRNGIIKWQKNLVEVYYFFKFFNVSDSNANRTKRLIKRLHDHILTKEADEHLDLAFSYAAMRHFLEAVRDADPVDPDDDDTPRVTNSTEYTNAYNKFFLVEPTSST